MPVMGGAGRMGDVASVLLSHPQIPVRDFFWGGGKLLGPGAERLQLPGWGCAALRAAGFGCDLSGFLALGVPALRAQGWRS